MAISESANNATISTTEYFLVSNSTTKTDQTNDAFVQGWIDFGAMQSGDQYEVKVYEKVNGGTQRTTLLGTLTGAQSSHFLIPAMILMDAWEFSAKRLAGTDRSIRWSIRQVS
jgi:hypothetical protein